MDFGQGALDGANGFDFLSWYVDSASLFFSVTITPAFFYFSWIDCYNFFSTTTHHR